MSSIQDQCRVQYLCLGLLVSLCLICPCTGESQSYQRPDKKQMLLEYFQDMTQPEIFVEKKGPEFRAHRDRLRMLLLKSMGLWPLPERIALASRKWETLDHEWCTIQSISYRLWPDVQVTGLLYIPKRMHETPAPAMLCPHGHWQDFFAHPCVQERCLMFAKSGYVVFCPPQLHYEDLMLGISHQTLNVWSNMRALDYLQGLPQVDDTRIGVCGCSGGGLQTQMLVALDDRVRVATIAGFTCNYKHIMAFAGIHCRCNHFPNVMRFTDHPEISTLGLPTPVQYLTMNDWTKSFAKESFPLITGLYQANGTMNSLDCLYESTDHNYDKSKRERTYWWMEKHLRPGSNNSPIVEPPEITTFAPETILKLCPEVSQEQTFPQLSQAYKRDKGYKSPAIASKRDWAKYHDHMSAVLEDLLGMQTQLPRRPVDSQARSTGLENGSGSVGKPDLASSGPFFPGCTLVSTIEQTSPASPSLPGEKIARSRADDGVFRQSLVIERLNCPTEGSIAVSAIVLRAQDSTSKAPIILLYDQREPEELLGDTGPGSAQALAREGAIVVLPDTRFIKEFGPGTTAQKNAIVWGRPFTGMACTDICAVLDRICPRPKSNPRTLSKNSVIGPRVRIITRNSGAHAIAALFAAILDKRINSLDLDFQGQCFENRKLPLIPFVLQHGDVLQWAALLADRDLTLRHPPESPEDVNWLVNVFKLIHKRGELGLGL